GGGAGGGRGPAGVMRARQHVTTPRRSAAASTGAATAVARKAPPSPRRSPSSSGPSSRSTRAASRRLDSALPAALFGLDEDVDLVRSLVALLIGHGECRRVLADLVVGVHRVLIGTLRPVTEVPAELEGAPTLLLDRGGELHLEGRGTLIRLGLRDHVELVFLFLVGPCRGRRRRGS